LRSNDCLVLVICATIFLSALAVLSLTYGQSGNAEVTQTRNFQFFQLQSTNADITRFKNLEYFELAPDHADVTRYRNSMCFQQEPSNADVTRYRNSMCFQQEPSNADVIRYRNLQFFELTPSPDNEPPVVKNVRHEPLYPNSTDTIHFYADVTDNVAVASVQLNYTENGGKTWALKNMALLENNTYSTSLGPYPQGQVLGFYVIAYDTSGNKAYGSEIVPPLPEPPRVAPILVSNKPPNLLPNGRDISYNTTNGGTEIYANVTELGIYVPGVWYNISYSLNGGLTWISQQMTQVSNLIWKHWINATTNMLFKITASNGNSTRVYWIIVAPWKYPVYLYFSTNEQYYPVAGLDFDGDTNVSNNWISYQNDASKYTSDFMNNDIDHDGTPDVWSYAYMNPKTVDDGCLVIEYWIYYAFHRFPMFDESIRFDHEHDFVPLYLWIDLATGNIKKLACAQNLWVNHYVFDVENPPKAINLAVEEGGHGMALLKTGADGSPEVNAFGWYTVLPGVNQMGGQEGFVPFREFWTIKPGSFRAQLYPWVIYDPRVPSSQLHLFDDPSTLTNGLSLDALSPLLPNVISDVPQYYGFLTDLLGTNCVLKTTYGAPLLGNLQLSFSVMAPLYRQEFSDPAKLWRKVSFGWWLAKEVVKEVISDEVTEGVSKYFKTAGILGFLRDKVVGDVTDRLSDKLLVVFIDPAQGCVMDFQGNALGYKNGNATNTLLGGAVLTDRNMTNDLYDVFFILTNCTDGYTYWVNAEGTGTYNMTISLTNATGSEITFDAINIPTANGSVHKFVVDWNMLKEGGLGLEVWIDQNGDGVFEHEFRSGSVLTGAEFWQTIAHDISVKNVAFSKNVVGEGFTLLLNVTVENQGLNAETFNVSFLANATLIGTKRFDTMPNGTSRFWNFAWNTTGVPCGKYTLSAYATPVPGETDTADNNYTGGWVEVRLRGFVTPPSPTHTKVSLADFGKLKLIYSKVYPYKCPPYDVNHPDTYYYLPSVVTGKPEYLMPDIDGNGKVQFADIGKEKLIYSGMI
jgi:hypothetical protein